MSFGLAEAYVEFRAKNQDEVHGVIDSIGKKLAGLPVVKSIDFGPLKEHLQKLFQAPTQKRDILGNLIGDQKAGALYPLRQKIEGLFGGVGKAVEGIAGKLGASLGQGVGTTAGTTAGSLMGSLIGAGLGTAFGSLVPVVGNLVGQIAGKLVGAITGAVSKTLELAAAFERVRLKFAAATGSERLGDRLRGELSKRFRGTEVDMAEVNRLASSQAAEARIRGETVDPAAIANRLAMLGNIAEGTGESFGGMAAAYQRAEVSGRVTALTLNAMKPIADQIAADFSKVYGQKIDVDQVTRWAEEGKVGLDHIKAAIDRLNAQGMFGTTIERQRGSLAGLLARVDGVWSDLKTKFSFNIVESLNLKGLVSWFEKAVKNAFDFWETFNKIVPVSRVLNAIFGKIWSIGGQIADVFGRVADALRPLGEAMAELWDELGNIWYDLTGNTQTLKTLLQPVVFAFKAMASAMAETARHITTVLQTLQKFPQYQLLKWVTGGNRGDGGGADFNGGNAMPALNAGKGGWGDFSGIANLAEKMQAAAAEKEIQREVVDNTKRTAAATEKIANAVTGDGIKIAVPLPTTVPLPKWM